MEIIQKIALVFTIIGGINWGLVGFFDFNLVEYIFGSINMLPGLIYSIVGICSIINIGILFNNIESNM